MCLAQGPQHNDAGKAKTRRLSVSSQALFTTAIPVGNNIMGGRMYRQYALFLLLIFCLFVVVVFSKKNVWINIKCLLNLFPNYS